MGVSQRGKDWSCSTWGYACSPLRGVRGAEQAAGEGVGKVGHSWTTPGALLGCSDMSELLVVSLNLVLCVTHLLGGSDAEVRASGSPSVTSSSTNVPTQFSQLYVYRCHSSHSPTLAIQSRAFGPLIISNRHLHSHDAMASLKEAAYFPHHWRSFAVTEK